MYTWLEDEIAKIRTNKFHRVDGPATAELRHAVDNCNIPFPLSYKEFLLRFGNSFLYRRSSYWLVEVFASPREAVSKEVGSLIQFGRTHEAIAYFKKESLIDGHEAPVLEWKHGQGFKVTATSFADWLQKNCNIARKRFTKKEWQSIENGPLPFTDHELAVVQARKSFRFRVIGIAVNGDLEFEVENGSKMTLAYLSVGIRGKLRPPKIGPLEGGGYLPISSIEPGKTGVLQYDCYKQYILPEHTEVYSLPEPGPEDRDQYWEFKTSAMSE
jgi:hypothetical protein